MTILETIRGKPGPKPAVLLAAQAPAIAEKLKAAEAELRDLEAQHGTAALDALVGEAGAQSRFDELERNLAKVRNNVGVLRAAHKAAVERDEATIVAQRTSLRKTQLNAMRKHLEARNAAAEKFSAAIAEAAAQYHAMIDRSAKAIAACPIGSTWPQGTLCEIDPLRRVVQHEIFRLSATPGNRDGRTLPGAELPHVNVEWQPEAIKPLAERLKEASEFTVATLTGKEAV